MSYGKIDPKLLATIEVLQSRITELEHQVKCLGVINATRQKETAQDDDARRRQRRAQDYGPAQARPQAPQGVIYRIIPL